MATATAPELRAKIDAANRRFMDAFARGDARGVAECYTGTGAVLPPNGEPIQGAAGLEGFWRGAMEAGIASASLETVELEGGEGAAYEVGRYVLAGRDGQTLDQGKYVVIWHDDGGRWKLHRDIWNSSQPAAG